jgi:hypothetical protein
MPIPSSALEEDPHLRVLVMGPPKLGKTTTAVCTSEGKTRVLLCESDTALSEAKRRKGNFDFERCLSEHKTAPGTGAYEQMTTFLAQAKEDAKAGRIQNVLIDPLSDFADRLLSQSMKINMTDAGNEDGRRAYPHCTKRLLHCLDLAFTIPCHVIVVSHYLEVGGQEMGLKKTGDGIVPLLPGQARARVAAKFNDVIWFDLDKTDVEKRCFYTGPQGAWGPGCRSLSRFAILPADFTKLLKTFKTGLPTRPIPAKPNGASPPKPATKPTIIKGR